MIYYQLFGIFYLVLLTYWFTFTLQSQTKVNNIKNLCQYQQSRVTKAK